jgi:hypothetical protein
MSNPKIKTMEKKRKWMISGGYHQSGYFSQRTFCGLLLLTQVFVSVSSIKQKKAVFGAKQYEIKLKDKTSVRFLQWIGRHLGAHQRMLRVHIAPK